MRDHHKRLTSETRRQILRVVMSVFARQGFQGTTTRQIAQRAGVNEAIIFRHFPHKEDVYGAIIDHMCRGAHGHAELCERLGTDENDREAFAAIAEDILRCNTRDSTFTRLLLFTALESHRLSRRFFRTYVARHDETLASHIRRRGTRAGRVDTARQDRNQRSPYRIQREQRRERRRRPPGKANN